MQPDHQGSHRSGGVGAETASARRHLRGDTVGVAEVVFFVIAAAAPLTGVVALFPVMIGSGSGVGIAGTYVVTTCVLLLFAVGYTAMSRHVTNAGAFYTYIAQGLGRPPGLGAATLAIFAYSCVQFGLYGAFGFFAAQGVSDYFGVTLPWWIYAFVAMAVCLFLGVRQVNIGALVLGVLLAVETLILVVLDIAILSEGGAGGLSLAPFAPSAIFSGAFGVSLMFAHACYIGFEATAIYGEESRNPTRTIPRATYVAVTLMGVFFTVTAWLIVNAWGVGQAVSRAQEDPGTFIFDTNTRYAGPFSTDVMSVLIITSVFAAIVAFHNTVARYLFALGRQDLLWSRLGSTHPITQSPYVACVAQTATAAVVVAAFAALGRDPFAELFAWVTGVGTIGIILLQAVCSIAVFVFFRRRDVDRRVWNTVVAPLLGTLGLLAFVFFALKNFNALTGAQGSLSFFLIALVGGFAVAGVAWALWMRRFSPESYERVGALVSANAQMIEAEEEAMEGEDETDRRPREPQLAEEERRPNPPRNL